MTSVFFSLVLLGICRPIILPRGCATVRKCLSGNIGPNRMGDVRLVSDFEFLLSEYLIIPSKPMLIEIHI